MIEEDGATRPMTPDELEKNGYSRDYHELNWEEKTRIENERVQALRIKINSEDTSDYDKDPDRFHKMAKLLVVSSYNSTHEVPDQLEVDQLYIVWFAKTLKNWKALISTSVPGDGLYFEVTYNGEKLETYVDTYIKDDNQVFSHHDQ